MKTILFAALIALLATACGGSGKAGGESAPPATVAQVIVSPATLSLNRGDEAQLFASVLDSAGRPLQGKVVIWSSDDTSKVSVTANGVAKALSAGTTKITATAEGKSASTQVSVAEPVGPVSRVTLNAVSESLEEGASLQLEATAYDEFNNVVTGRGVRWSSGAAGIAAVEPGGLVTGLRPGTVSVTATIDGKSASATIRVFSDYPFGLIHGISEIETPEVLYSLDINDPAAVPLALFGSGRSASHAAPSPDGSRIAFVVYGIWGGTFWESAIFVAHRDGSNAQRVTDLPARNVEPAWSPDGTRIAFSSQVFMEPAEIWVVNADGSNPVNLTADQANSSKYSPAWSPRLADGNYRIAYALESDGSSNLWTMLADGSDKFEITNDPRYFDSEPNWSPDGSTLVYQRTGDGIFGDLYLVSSAGGAGRALMPANPLAYGQFGPTWSPDGQLIAFTSKHADGEHYQVWTVWADGTRLAQRTQELVQHADPVWISRQ